MRVLGVIAVAVVSYSPFVVQAQGVASTDTQQAAQQLTHAIAGDIVGQMAQAMAAQIWPRIEAQMRSNVDAATMDEVQVEFRKAIHELAAQMSADTPAIYSKYFTSEEMRELTLFYRSSVGQKSLRLAPQIMSEYQQSSLPRMEAFGRNLESRIQAIIAKRSQK